MADAEHIDVARTSGGPCGADDPGRRVSLPVVELLTGRGFITGKSGSGKSNTASVVAENLLDSGFGLCIVDIDGEYYGLKEEYEILHVGDDEECDMQVTTEHAEKLASLALEQNVPIILDVSSFLDEDEAAALLTEVARHLFAKAKKQKQPFLLLVEEVHEYLPEGGSMGECGRMLIKIGKRGRKHGLGICGISQRPADVKKDYITQCDWLAWHRLTWDNDTKVVRRVLDDEYARAVEDLDDGEAFLWTDWADRVRQVQFDRKRTFDAGATPGLDDFERPDLKSVSSDLVSELEAISEEEKARESRIEELREELDRKNSRIAELETELQDARDLSRMAEQFVDALVENVDGQNPAVTEQERMRGTAPPARAGDGEYDADASETDEEVEAAQGVTDDEDATDGFAAMMGAVADGDDEAADQADATAVSDTATAGNGSRDEQTFHIPDDGLPVDGSGNGDSPSTNGTTASNGHPSTNGSASSNGSASTNGDSAPGDVSKGIDRDDGGDVAFSFAGTWESEDAGAGPDQGSTDEDVSQALADETTGTDSAAAQGRTHQNPGVPSAVREMRESLDDLDPEARTMLGQYCRRGAAKPLNVHFSGGGTGDRTDAYAYNRQLRTAEFIEHVGRGRYEPRLEEWLRDADQEGIAESRLDAYLSELERLRLQ